MEPPSSRSALIGHAHQPRMLRTIWLASVLVGVVCVVGMFALSSTLSSSSLLSVSGMEKMQKLEHRMSEQLADQELAHWNKINAAAFPTTSEVEAQGRSLVAPTFRKVAQHARMVQAQKDKLVMERLLKSVQEKDEAELQQVLKSEKQGLNKVKDFAVQKDTEKSKSTATANKAGAKKSVDTKAQGTEFKVEKGQKLGANDDAFLELNPPLEPPEHYDPYANMDPPIKKSAQSVLKLQPTTDGSKRPQAFTQKTLHTHTRVPLTQSKVSRKGDQKRHVKLQPSGGDDEKEETGKLGDNVMDVGNVVSAMSSFDDGDVHVDSHDLEDAGGYMFKAKHGQQQQLADVFKQKHGQRLFLGEGPWAHVPVEHEMAGDGVGANHDGANDVAVDRLPWSPEAQMHVTNAARPPCRYLCSDPNGCEGHEALTDGDCEEVIGRDWDVDGEGVPNGHPATYPAWSANQHGLFKSRQVQQLAGRYGRVAYAPLVRHRQRLFLGEGPWAHVPVEHEMAGDGVGANHDGANGVTVDRLPWSPEAQLRVGETSMKKVCMYHCNSPSGWCEGKEGLSAGDCEEVLDLEHDAFHDPQYHADYPATYDAYSGSTSGLFKAPARSNRLPSLSAMAAAQFRAQEASDSAGKADEPPGLSVLAQPHAPHAHVTGASAAKERNAPGLGALAPTAYLARLGRVQQRQQMLEGDEEAGEEPAGEEEAKHPWRASESPLNPRHTPKCLGGGKGPCTDEYIDLPTRGMNNENNGDVSLDVDKIVPFMYKNRGSSPMLRQHELVRVHAQETKAPMQMLAVKGALGDEVFGDNDIKVSAEKLKSKHFRWDYAPAKKTDKLAELQEQAAKAAQKKHGKLHALGGAMLAKKRMASAHKTEEASLDGMSDQVVSVHNGKADASRTPSWDKFYSPPADAAQRKTTVLAHTMLEDSEPAAADDAGEDSVPAAAPEPTLGDEYLDTTDNVNVDAGKVHSGPQAGELSWPTFYSGKVVHGGKEAARSGGVQGATATKPARTGLGLSDVTATDDMNHYFDALTRDPEHGNPLMN